MLQIAHPISIRQDDLLLRDFRDTDVSNVELILEDSSVTATLAASNRKNARAFLDARLAAAQRTGRKDAYLVIEDTTGFIGFVRVGFVDETTGRLGIAIRSDRWRQGWATRACELVMTWARGLGVQRFDAATSPVNERAEGLLIKLGFTLSGSTMAFEGAEGELRNVYIKD